MQSELETAITRRSALRLAGGALATATPALRPSRALSAADAGPIGFNTAPAEGVENTPLRRLYGKPPSGLEGALYRNGPGQFTRGGQSLNHWFDGDGLIRAFRITEDSASLTARFVDTPKRRRDEAADAFVTFGFGTQGSADAGLRHPDDANAANTSLLVVDDQLWALWEAGGPYVINPETLGTEGLKILRSDLAHMPFSAHPKIEPDGRIWNFGSSPDHPQIFLWRLSSGGVLETAALIDLPRASYLHDWAMTRTKLIIPLAPWIAEAERAPQVRRLRWRPKEGMKILVIDKDDLERRRIYDLPAGFLFHTGDAYEEPDGTIRFDACIAERPTLDAVDGARILKGQRMARPEPVATMVILRPDGRASVEKTPFTAEFPRIDPRRAGLKRDHLFAASEGATPPPSSYRFNALMAVDWRNGDRDAFDFGEDTLIEEHLYVPNSSNHSSGWLVGAGINLKEKATELYIFDSQNLSDGPVVAWRAPLALPIGFHGVWRS
ncbi:MAG: carotenoid oxygenase family protein [Pseudomonadota bacterium]